MKKNKNNVARKQNALIIIFSITFTFSMCLFNQFDVLFRNQVEFGIQPQEIILGFILFVLAVLAVSLLTLFLLARFCKTGFKIALALMLGFVLASYVQVLFLNGHYNGSFHDFAGEYKPVSTGIKIFNLFIWLIICLLPLALIFIEKRTKKQFFKKIALFASIIIIAMQVVGLAAAAPNADFARYDKSFYFSVDRQLELSERDINSEPEDVPKNIIIFILDRTAVGYTDEVFNKHPDAKKNFEGFTYYRENISEYGQTFPSVISMLTGERFEKTESRSDFSKRAWENATLFEELVAKKYTVNGLLDELSTYYSVDEIADKFDNIRYVSEDRKVNQAAAVTSMTKLSFQRTLPYVLKEATGFDYPNDLDRIVSNRTSDFFPSKIGLNSDNTFARKVNNPGLSAPNKNKTFSFVHLNSGHSVNWRETTYDTFKVLGKYFNQMKMLGIFESSTIILTSDHGAAGHGINSTLMIKESGQSGGEMKTNSTAKLSNGFFLSTIFEIIGAEDKKTTPSYFDIIYKDSNPERYEKIVERGLDLNRYYFDVSWDVDNQCTYYGKSIRN